jgi:hypothetical protein
MVKDQCECNPAIDVLLGEGGDNIYKLEPLCRLAEPHSWAKIPISILSSCDTIKTHTYGCEQSDVEIDATRLKSALEFVNLFSSAADESSCLDTPSFLPKFETVFDERIELTVPYGVGTYRGYEDIAEYLGILFSSLNHGWWQYNITVDPDKPARLEVSKDGKRWSQGASFSGSFLRGLNQYSDKYVEQKITFTACNTRARKFDVLPTYGFRDWVELFVQTAERSERWGQKDICRYHTKFCLGNPKTKQYESEQECLDYIGSLPSFSEACGINRPLSGLSLPCKFKHHFMIPANSGLHCAHIGRSGTHDSLHILKCDDIVECSEPNEGRDWPLVKRIGINTPQDIRAMFNKSNEDSDNEPFGCAVPINS